MNENIFSFIKKFEIDNNYYIYDVNTNALLKVDELVYFLIDENGKIDDIDVIYKKYPKSIIDNTQKKIREMKSKGFLSSQRPVITYFHKIKKENFHDYLFSVLNNKLHKITLVTSEACNLRCKYCAYSGMYLYKRTHSNKKMNIETMKKAIDFYFSHTANEEKNISFYGGEPLLNFNAIKECVNYCKRKYFKDTQFNMTTNGTLLNKEKINFLVKNNFSLLISIDGPKEIHDKFRVYKNGKGTFDNIRQNLKQMKLLHNEYYKKKVRFSIVLTPGIDFNVLNDFISNTDIKPSGFSFSDINDYFTIFFNQYSTEQLKAYAQNKTNIINSFCTKLAKNMEITELEKNMFKTKFFTIHRRDMNKLPGTYPPNGQCLIGERALLVNIDGSFNFCTRVNDSFNLGNLDNGFNYKFIEKIYFDLDKLFSEKCFGCWAIRFCNKCIRDVNKNGEIDEGVFNKMCEMKKRSILNEIKDYIKIRENNYHALDYLENVTVS